jgi:hypothetical protein
MGILNTGLVVAPGFKVTVPKASRSPLDRPIADPFAVTSIFQKNVSLHVPVFLIVTVVVPDSEPQTTVSVIVVSQGCAFVLHEYVVCPPVVFDTHSWHLLPPQGRQFPFPSQVSHLSALHFDLHLPFSHCPAS